MLIAVKSWLQTAGIAFLTLIVGWQLGAGSEQRRLIENGFTQVDVPQDVPSTGSGWVSLDPKNEADISQVWRVWNLLLEHYIDPDKLQTDKLVQGAAAGLVRAVDDPYTVLMDPVQNTEFRDSLAGNLEGIGAELVQREELIVVVAPIKGSPAQRAGLMPDDVIVSVNGETTEGLNLNETVSRIRGPKGTRVTLEIAREKAPDLITMEIVRDQIHVPSVESKTIKGKNGDIGYVALNQFGDSSINELREEFQNFKEAGVTAFILDLRFNGGGYLEGAIELVSMFQKDGKVVSVQHRKGEPENHFVNGRPLYPDIPLAILVNQGTASASEITAGALQDHKRAVIIGKTTFGKGTVQEVIDLPDGSSLRVTVARWLTPNGKDLGKEGVHPDIDLDRTQDDIKANKDPQLDAAVEWINGGSKIPARTGSGTTVKN